MPPLILASTSSYRQGLLRKLGIPFRSLAPQTDETPLPGENAHQLVMRLAQAKAHAVAQSLDQGWVIGSDQVCVIDEQILGKAGTHERAVEQLRRLSGHAITFYTGLCLWDVASLQRQVIVEPFVVHFRELNDAQINSYLHQERPYDCAGSFKSEALGVCLFERFEGRDPNTLVGLPLMALTDMFQTWGVTLPLERC